MRIEPPVRIDEIIGGDPSPHTPVLPDGRFGIDFAPVPAVSPGGPTVALFIAYRVEQPYLALYGGRVGDAINIVAVREDTGSVYFSPPVGPDSIPLALTMTDPHAPPPEHPLASSMESSFNVDLAALLVLPAEGATYHVFLWLDDIVSEIRTVYVPANSARHQPDAPRDRYRRPADAIELGAFAEAPVPGAGQVALARSPHAGESAVYGGWRPDPSRLQSAAAYVPPYFLTVLAFSHRDRQFGWASLDINTVPASVTADAFRVDPLALVGPSSREQTVFMLATAGNSFAPELAVTVPAAAR